MEPQGNVITALKKDVILTLVTSLIFRIGLMQ